MDRCIGFFKLFVGWSATVLSLFVIVLCFAYAPVLFVALLAGSFTGGENTYRDAILCSFYILYLCCLAWVFITLLQASREWRSDGWSTMRGHWKPFSAEKTQQIIQAFQNRTS